MGAVVQACVKRVPRAASASNAGVSTSSDSKPTLSARVVSMVTRRIDGRDTSIFVAGGGCSREHEKATSASRTTNAAATALLGIRE